MNADERRQNLMKKYLFILFKVALVFRMFRLSSVVIGVHRRLSAVQTGF
jgi:hypothetical protein